MNALVDDAKSSGAWVFNVGLHAPSRATALKYHGDELLTTDGPFTEGKEHIGGFLIVKAPDLDGALEWGQKLARILSPLSIEVRPFQDDQAH